MNIKSLIGEATEYDKKLTLEEKRPKSWLKSVSAFANGIGGVLIFGVSDDEQWIGLDNAHNFAEKISETIKSKMDPIPQIVLKIQQENGKDFVLSFGLMNDDKVLTNAGALLADDSPIYQSRLFCTHWYGLDKASGVMEAIDDKEYRGSLVTLLQNGTDFIKNNTKKRWKKTDDNRIEMPDIPERAAFECLVNALIHRDYLETGSEVHIDIYDDRMEIYSPGGMYAGTLVQNLDTDHVPSKRRNPIIADIFNRMNYMERRGSGFKKIKGDYHQAINYHPELEPRFYSDTFSFWVTLYNLNYHTPTEIEEKPMFESLKPTFETSKAMFQTYVSSLNAKQSTKDKILQIHEKIGFLHPFGRKEIMLVTGISSFSAGELIKKMLAANLIQPVSGHGKGKYQFTVKSE